MEAERENFYILLDLDPTIQDWDKIEATIRTKKSDWSRDEATAISPKRKRQAGQNKALLPEIDRVMKDPDLRKKEAEQAVERRKTVREERLRELRRDLKVVCARGHLLDKEVAKLVKRYTSEGLTEEDIRREISVEVRPDGVESEARTKSLDPIRLKNIEANLATLGHADLYHFLGAHNERSASCRSLMDKIAEIDADVRKHIRKTPEVSARQELVGHCKLIFASDETRKSYDQTLGEESLKKVDGQFDLLAGDAIDPKTFLMLMRTGMEGGVSEARCRQHIREMAKKRNMIVETATTTSGWYQQCGHCLTINDPKDHACHKCGRSLQVCCPMPHCKKTMPSTHWSCTGCGFPLGDLPEIQSRLSSARAHLDKGDLSTAQEVAKAIRDDCIPKHPKYPLLEELLTSISQRRRSRDEAMSQLRKLVDDSQIEKASRLLATMVGMGPVSPDLLSVKEKIDKAHAQAEQAYQAAIDADTKGKRDEAFSHCCRALTAARDYRPARQLMAKFPPEPPATLDASAERIISLSWKPSPSQGALEYNIVRRDGAAPSSPTDGECLAVATANRYDDTTAEPGVTYYYAVLTVRGGVESTCRSAGPLMSVADVADLSFKAGDKCVDLSWQLPKHATGVEVWRQDRSPPTKRGQGERIEQVRRGGVTDHKVTNGVSYGYMVVAIFRAVDGSLRASHGVSIIVRPESPPLPLTGVTAHRDGSQIVLRWQPPSHGSVEIYRLQRDPALKLGQHCDIETIATTGKKLTAKDRCSAVDDLRGERIVFYLPVTFAGSVGVVGGGLYVTAVEDVAGLKVTVKETTLLAKWEWPPDCSRCRIAIRFDQFPTGPDDPQASRSDYLLSIYESKGGFYTSLPAAVRQLFMTVHAALPVADQVIFATGTAEGARCRVSIVGGSNKRCELRYRIALRKSLFGKSKTIRVTIKAGRDAVTLPDLCVVGKSRTMPISLDDGKLLASFPAGQVLRPGQDAEFTFSPGQLPKDTLARLFPANDREADWLILTPETPRMEIGL